jgi:uncharacterized repeat protein (TIGR01451 family)
MLVKTNGSVSKRYYVDVYPSLTPTSTSLGVPQPPSADLTIDKSDSVDPATEDEPFSYTLTVHNNGPNTARNIEVTDMLPAGLTHLSSSASSGLCGFTPSTGTVDCSLDDLAAGGDSTVTIDVIAPNPGSFDNSASVTSSTTDPTVPNTDSETTQVNAAPVPPSCVDTTAPSSHIDKVKFGRHAVRAGGSASDAGCAGLAGVSVYVAKKLSSGLCRFLGANGKLQRKRSCHDRTLLSATGTSSWKLKVPRSKPLPSGKYRVGALATDKRGNREASSRANRKIFNVP